MQLARIGGCGPYLNLRLRGADATERFSRGRRSALPRGRNGCVGRLTIAWWI